MIVELGNRGVRQSTAKVDVTDLSEPISPWCKFGFVSRKCRGIHRVGL
jgi:hypothetical protein